ncbi:hypothetical protein NKY39_15980 [Sinorhizobium meliloti]|uniref:hypothetical protein n=1 Tax=Rhizobium meliloti TaxID=382 RepID=UPI003D64FBFA
METCGRNFLCVAAAFAGFLMAQPALADEATCLAAAHRIFAFVEQEAKGTRHEAQMAAAIKKKDKGSLVAELAAGLNSDQCAFLMIAPDSTIRALAKAALPERNGQ